VSTAYARHPNFAHVVHRRHPKRADFFNGMSLTLEPGAFCMGVEAGGQGLLQVGRQLIDGNRGW
jgi:hypothetical protein